MSAYYGNTVRVVRTNRSKQAYAQGRTAYVVVSIRVPLRRDENLVVVDNGLGMRRCKMDQQRRHGLHHAIMRSTTLIEGSVA